LNTLRGTAGVGTKRKLADCSNLNSVNLDSSLLTWTKSVFSCFFPEPRSRETLNAKWTQEISLDQRHFVHAGGRFHTDEAMKL
jgi:hypothetical protein